MTTTSIGLPPDLAAYLLDHGVREPKILTRLRAETATMNEAVADMQIAPEQGALLAMLVRLMGARRCIELGTFTGYSSLAVALALPPEGRLVCCDVSAEWTSVARRYWAEAGVADRVELRLGEALESLDALLDDGSAGTFDFAFVDASKEEYPEYHERLLRLLRSGGLIVYDNVFWDGAILDPNDHGADTEGVRRLNDRLATDERVDVVMLPVADGVTLARKR
jgi:predicted O-methyltransferase YrrM